MATVRKILLTAICDVRIMSRRSWNCPLRVHWIITPSLVNNPRRVFVTISPQPFVGTPREPTILLYTGNSGFHLVKNWKKFLMNTVMSILFNLTNYYFFKIKCPLFYRSSKSTLIPCLYCSIVHLNFLEWQPCNSPVIYLGFYQCPRTLLATLLERGRFSATAVCF